VTTTVVWDLGGVVLHWDVEELLRTALPELAVDEEQVHTWIGSIFQDFAPWSDWSQFDRGTIDAGQLVARISRRTGLARERVDTLITAIDDHLTFRPETMTLIDRLRAEGHRLVFLSNMPLPYADRLQADPWFSSAFENGVFSCRVHLVKPEPELFELAGGRLGLDPGRTVFVDDREPNLAQARRHGWSGLLFRDAAQCGEDLVGLLG
jgi:putative hydrolase of the HAD superfamily